MAIDFSSYTTGLSVGSATCTLSHTITGSNPLLLVGFSHDYPGDRITGVTYNGVAMTRLEVIGLAYGPMYLYFLNAPASGTHNVVATANIASNSFAMTAASYTGCDQSASAVHSHTSILNLGVTSQSATLDSSVVSATNDCWMVGTAQTGGSPTAGTNTTIRYAGQYSGVLATWYDSNGPKTPAGSLTLNLSASSGLLSMLVAMIKPYVPPTYQPRPGSLGSLL